MDHNKDLMRFMRFVEKTDTCWIWIGSRFARGYGQFWLWGRRCYAHRAALMLLRNQSVPAGKLVMHSCDNPPCVNPDHLSIGTQFDNMRDAARKGRTVRVGDWHGEKNPKAKLSSSQRRSLEVDISSGGRTFALARQYGLTPTRVQQIRREIKKDGGGWDIEGF